jgi:dipeptidyl aminopeptidase/acylaminoacyl peptidase
MFKEIQIVPAAGGAPSPVCDTPGKLGPPKWSPDGGRIAFRAGVSSNDPFAGSIFVVAAPSGEPVNLTPDIEATVAEVDWLDMDTLVFLAFDGTKTTLNKMSPDGGGIKKISKDGPAFTSFSFSEDGNLAALTASTFEHPRELYLWKKGGLFSRGVGSMERLTFSNPGLDAVDLAPQEVVSWTSVDGKEIQGVLMRPLSYQEGTRYPLVVQVHGGPEGVYLDGWTTSFYGWSQCLAAKGYAVLMPNYRGSIGRGVAFSKGDHKDLGGKEFADVLSGVDHLVNLGLVDADRVGMGGTSYGGYMSALAATAHSDRFAATVDHAGISDWNSFTGTTDIPYEMCMVHWDLWVFDDPELCWDRSPIAHVSETNAPVLIVHGRDDHRVDPCQASEFYTALKEKGVDTELVFYPRESHGLSERAHRLDYMNRVLAWFDKHLVGGM